MDEAVGLDSHPVDMNARKCRAPVFIPRTEDPTGIGEIATVVTTPALLNAAHDTTGKRIRRLPMAASDLKPV